MYFPAATCPDTITSPGQASRFYFQRAEISTKRRDSLRTLFLKHLHEELRSTGLICNLESGALITPFADHFKEELCAGP